MLCTENKSIKGLPHIMLSFGCGTIPLPDGKAATSPPPLTTQPNTLEKVDLEAIPVNTMNSTIPTTAPTTVTDAALAEALFPLSAEEAETTLGKEVGIPIGCDDKE